MIRTAKSADYLGNAGLRRDFELFFPYAAERIQEIESKLDNFRFSYYISASIGMKILSNEQAWLRNAAFMNDFSEVHHGQSCLQHAWRHTEPANQLKELLNLIDANAVFEFEQEFDNSHFSRIKNSYLLCISEHGDRIRKEDRYGRLSMWRAYGGKTNVAFVFKPNIFLGEADAFSIFTSPILYADKILFAERFGRFVEGLLAQKDYVIALGWPKVKDYLHRSMRASVLSTKHPGFSEEKERRLIYSPDYDTKKRVLHDIVDVEGVPQSVYKIPLKDYPEDGLTGATIPDFLERIIAGSVEFPYEMKQAFVEKLKSLKIEDAESRVIVSEIPLRRV